MYMKAHKSTTRALVHTITLTNVLDELKWFFLSKHWSISQNREKHIYMCTYEVVRLEDNGEM